jgi:Uma2 family endonuclease
MGVYRWWGGRPVRRWCWKGEYVSMTEQHFTPDEFQVFIDKSENEDRWFELYQSVLYEMPYARPIDNIICGRFMTRVMNYLRDYQLGFAIGFGCPYFLPNGDVFVPRGAFISKQREPRIPPKYLIAPDIVVELISPVCVCPDLFHKVESYTECGTKLVWVFYPEENFVRVWRPSGSGRASVQKLDINGVLDGEVVLPGFAVAVKEIFPAK